MLLQSRSELVSEAEAILSDMSHRLIHVVKGCPESSQQQQARPADLHIFSQQMLIRLSR